MTKSKKYQLIPQKGSVTRVLLLVPEYEGIVYEYGVVSLTEKENGEGLHIHFEHKVLEIPDDIILIPDKKFTDLLFEILVELIEVNIQNYTNALDPDT